jgi:hypothetical protein
MMESEEVSEMLVSDLTREDFSTFIRCENFKFYVYILLSLLVLPFSVPISCLQHCQMLTLLQQSSVATYKILYSPHTHAATELQQGDGMV